MKISNAFRNNAILRKFLEIFYSRISVTCGGLSQCFLFVLDTVEATNLFLRQNGQIVLEIMQPQLQTKLATEFKQIANHLLDRVPRDWFYVE